MEKKALMLFSGGLDSVCLGYNLIAEGYKLTLLFFEYGQMQLDPERRMARKFAHKTNSKLIEKRLDIWSASNSVMLNKNKDIDFERKGYLSGEASKIYIESRNVVFFSIATSLAESLKLSQIFVAFQNEGQRNSSQYYDATTKFVEDFNRTIESRGITFLAPFIDSPKASYLNIIRANNITREDFWSCNTPYYDVEGNAIPCGKCGDCETNRAIFEVLLPRYKFKDTLFNNDMRLESIKDLYMNSIFLTLEVDAARVDDYVRLENRLKNFYAAGTRKFIFDFTAGGNKCLIVNILTYLNKQYGILIDLVIRCSMRDLAEFTSYMIPENVMFEVSVEDAKADELKSMLARIMPHFLLNEIMVMPVWNYKNSIEMIKFFSDANLYGIKEAKVNLLDIYLHTDMVLDLASQIEQHKVLTHVLLDIEQIDRLFLSSDKRAIQYQRTFRRENAVNTSMFILDGEYFSLPFAEIARLKGNTLCAGDLSLDMRDSEYVPAENVLKLLKICGLQHFTCIKPIELFATGEVLFN